MTCSKCRPFIDDIGNGRYIYVCVCVGIYIYICLFINYQKYIVQKRITAGEASNT